MRVTSSTVRVGTVDWAEPGCDLLLLIGLFSHAPLELVD
jgi:hypothetical protein